MVDYVTPRLSVLIILNLFFNFQLSFLTRVPFSFYVSYYFLDLNSFISIVPVGSLWLDLFSFFSHKSIIPGYLISILQATTETLNLTLSCIYS